VFTPHIASSISFGRLATILTIGESQFPPLIEPEALSRLASEGCSCAQLANQLTNGELDGYLLKPMNCPMHIKIYASELRSYRNLPVRLSEF